MSISIHVKKAFDRIQYPPMINTLRKLETGKSLLNIIKDISKRERKNKSTANVIVNSEGLGVLL